MSWLKNRRNQEGKKRLQKICFISKTAFDLAVSVYGWINPAANLLGAAVIPHLTDAAEELLSNWDVNPTLEDQYFSAVENSLARVELLFYNKHGKRELVHELAGCVETMETFDMNIEDVISNAETYQAQYMTSIDVREIVHCFEQVFPEEVARYDQLSHYYIYQSTHDSLSMLKQVHILLNTNGERLDSIYQYVSNIKDDTTEIKSGVQKIQTSVDRLKELLLWLREVLSFSSEVLVHSMVIFFAFAMATSLFDAPICPDFRLFAVILLSEVLCHMPMVRTKGSRAFWTTIPTQTFFITASAFMTTGNQGYHVLICSLIGVTIKCSLKYYRNKDSQK